MEARIYKESINEISYETTERFCNDLVTFHRRGTQVHIEAQGEVSLTSDQVRRLAQKLYTLADRIDGDY